MTRQHGIGMIAAIVILVILASLAAAIASFSSAQQLTSAQDVMATKAWQAAKSGNEWGLYQAIKDLAWPNSGTKCSTVGQDYELDLVADTGFRVRVTCTTSQYNEGQDPGPPVTVHVTTVYTITSIACNAASCPSTSPSASGYVERSRTVIATN